MLPKVTLVSWTANPIQTIYCAWQHSKSNDPVPDPEYVDPNNPHVLEVFKGVIDSHIPVSDFVDFVFFLDNISISFREQMVRHRVGMRFGPRMGVDVVPDIGDSSWWGQSMRILDMGKFADEERFRIPKSLEGKSMPVSHDSDDAIPLEDVYRDGMAYIQETYKKLIANGVPMEDARELIPLGATHRFAWKINLTALKHVIGKRGCWIPQLDLWEPIITGMIQELSSKVHPYFQNLVHPPCIKNGKFKECVYQIDNQRRISREDETLPCPLYLTYHQDKSISEIIPKDKQGAFDVRVAKYQFLWKREPYTFDEIEQQEFIFNNEPEAFEL